ncbi:bifunctional DNA primase/polymerase [Microbacterium sp. 22303]|uniref:bifunctional DNA primase/polymerase n=1 Tax=Microbacterium sp. 22303 TaxID=3453905 RepID=UPI003F82725D
MPISELQHALREISESHLALPTSALVYAAAGLRVFPCAPGAKEPLTKHGFHDASTDPSRIRRWWTWQPEANIGIATGGGVDVLDVDVHGTGDGFATLRFLHDAGLVGGALQAVRTPSGGAHLYFPSDPSRAQQNWSRSTVHIDFRGLGGYVIAPPSSITIAGQQTQYRTLTIGNEPAPVNANRICALLTPPRRQRSHATPAALATDFGAEQLAAWVSRAAEGNRNSSLFWAGCRLAENGWNEGSMRALLDGPARQIGLTERETAATLHSAWRAAQLGGHETPTAGASRLRTLASR